MSTIARQTWFDGTMMPSEQATLPVMTSGLHYGVAVFEGIRCFGTDAGPAIFRLRDHMLRLLASARVLGFRDLPWDVDLLTSAAKQVVHANDLTECYVRPVIYLGDGGWNLTIDSGVPHVAIGAWEWSDFMSEEAAERGVRAHVSSFTRHHPNVAMTKAKIAGNYANSVLARTECVRLGFDEAIMLDPQGFVAECTGENLFLVEHGALITPPSASVLEGITRDSLISLASRMGLAVHERTISRDQLYLADELLLCGTAADVVAVREVDHRQIAAGAAGPVTRALQREYRSVIRGFHPLSAQWLDPIGSGVPVAAGAERHDLHAELGYGHGV